MSSTTPVSSTNPHYETIKQLMLEEQLPLSEVKKRLKGRISESWIREIYSYIKADLKDLYNPKPSRKGGFKPFSESERISPVHLAVGVKLANFRIIQKQMEVLPFCKAYGFSNHTRLRQMEIGAYDFSLSELLWIAEIIGCPLEELTRTFSENIHKSTQTA